MTASYDLHLHTYWSYDAAAHPASYFRAAERLGMRCIALTEHHVLDGLQETERVARQHPSVHWITGAELTVNTSLGSVDLLCYGLPQQPAPALQRVLSQYHRWQRAYGSALSAGMVALGFPYDDRQRLSLLESYRPSKAIRVQGNTHVRNGAQRAHFIRKRFISDETEYGGVLRRAGERVPRPTYPEAADVVRAVHEAGAVIAMAHPHGHCPRAEEDRLDQLTEECALDGLECAHTSMPEGLSPRFREYCVKHGLFSVAGSDCHLDHETGTLFAEHGGDDAWLDEFFERLV